MKDTRQRWAERLLLFLFLAVGAYLRLRHLGYLGFNGDEDITTLAVKGILKHGYPRFPTGMVYLRALPYSYLLALSVKLLGVSEFALRLPAALFSTGTIVLTYLFARRSFGSRTALVAALLMSVSPWEVAIGREARMYAPFTFFYVLTLDSIYRHYIERNTGSVIPFLLAIVTCLVHVLGFTLALIFLYPFLFRPTDHRPRLRLLFGSGLVVACFFIWRHAQGVAFQLPVGANPSSALVARRAHVSWFHGIVQKIGWPFHLPGVDLLTGLLRDRPAVFAIVSLICALLVGWTLLAWFRTRRPRDLVVPVIVVFTYLHQLILVAVAFCFRVFSYREGLRAFRRKENVRLGLLLTCAFAIWLAYGVAFEQHFSQYSDSRLKQVIMSFLDLPRLWIVYGYWTYVPVLAGVAAVGGLWCFDRGARRPPETGPLFLLYAFTLPVLVHGLFRGQENFRYNTQVYPLFTILAVLGLLKWPDALRALVPQPAGGRRSSRRIRAALVVMVTTVMAGAVVSSDVSPVAAWLITSQDYKQKGDARQIFREYGLDYYPDHKTTAAYVKRDLRPGDVVVVMDWLEQFNYIGYTDYWIRTAGYEHQSFVKNGRLRDLYTGAVVVPSVRDLQRVLAENADRRIWIVTSSLEVRRMTVVNEEIVKFLDGLSKYLMYVGKDGESKVYLIPERGRTGFDEIEAN